MLRFFWVCIGGAAGTAARYALSGWTARRLGAGFPWGTLAVNVLGSFAIGVVMQVGLATNLLSPTLRIALASGVLGGFTTYSSFNYETVRSLAVGAWLLAFANMGGMVASCLAAGFAGLAAGRWLAGL